MFALFWLLNIIVGNIAVTYTSEAVDQVVCRTDYACVVVEDNLIDVIKNIQKESECQDLCAVNSYCTFYTWFDDNSSNAYACFLFKECDHTELCPGCVSGPPSCSD